MDVVKFQSSGFGVVVDYRARKQRGVSVNACSAAKSPGLERTPALPPAQFRSTMTTRRASSCRSLCQSQDRRATAVLLVLLLSVVSVDAAYRGVSTRDCGSKNFYCEVSFIGVTPRERVWMGTYDKEELAARACDVAYYYINIPSEKFNFQDSAGLILNNCKPRSAYGSLTTLNERRRFIKDEASALIKLLTSEDHVREDVNAPPFVPVSRTTGDIACDLVDLFRNKADRLREFLAWLMHLLNAATQTTYASEETISQLDIEEALHVGGDQFLDAARVKLILESFEVLATGGLWLSLIANSLPLLLQIFTKTNAHDVKDATINANDPTFTKQERCESRAECSTKRLKANHPSIKLVPDQEDFTAILMYHKDGAWQCAGYDMRSKKWRKLPPFSFLPAPIPAPDFCDQHFSVCGHGSLMCVNASIEGAELVVFNPLTEKKQLLPRLISPRHPVLLHIFVDSATNSYKVIVAGSSRLDEEHLSKKMEMFDSKTSEWEEMCDLPGPAFGLNEYQTGVYVNGIFYVIAFLEGDGSKGALAFDVENRKWLPNMTCPISWSSSLTVTQLVENNGVVYLFSELMDEIQYTHRIDVLEISHPNAGEATCHWRNEFQMTHSIRVGELLSKHTCVGFGEGKLCIFDNLGTGGVVYDMRFGRLSEILKQRSRDPALDLVTKIPASFNLQLSPDSDPFPSSVDDIQKEPALIVHPYLQW